MTSIGNYKRQVSNDSAYFINVGNMINKVYTSPAGGSTPVVTYWASSFGAGDFSTAGCYASSINAAGSAIFRDMGRTVTSSGTFFRKVQLVVPQGAGSSSHPLVAGATSTFGVAGNAANGGVTPDYLTGYIVLGFDGLNAPAPVAKYGL